MCLTDLVSTPCFHKEDRLVSLEARFCKLPMIFSCWSQPSFQVYPDSWTKYTKKYWQVYMNSDGQRECFSFKGLSPNSITMNFTDGSTIRCLINWFSLKSVNVSVAELESWLLDQLLLHQMCWVSWDVCSVVLLWRPMAKPKVAQHPLVPRSMKVQVDMLEAQELVLNTN